MGQGLLHLDPQVLEAKRRRNAGYLIYRFFGVRLRPSQARLANDIVFDLHRRIAVRSATQVGKTFTVAVALCMKILVRKGHRIGWVAPTFAKTKVSQGYVADIIVRSPHLQALLDYGAGGSADSLKREATKTRLVFKDGGEIHFHSAEGTGLRLMSFGSYDTLVEEEAGETKDEVARKMIARMASKPSSISPRGCQRVKLGNPWRKPSHFHDACTSPRWHSVHWGLELCLSEGAFDPEFIEEQRESLTETEFRVLYEAEFPESVSGALFQDDVLDDASRLEASKTWPVRSVAVDIAEDGADFTVATRLRRDPKSKQWCGEQLTIRHGDPEVQVDQFAAWMDESGQERSAYPVRYDAIGVGSAWGPLLRSRGFRAIPVKWSHAPQDKSRFAKSKSEHYWNAREVLGKGLVSLAGADPRLVEQLRRPSYEFTPAGKIEVKVPGRKTGEKSPDHADSYVLALLEVKPGGRPKIGAW